MRGITGVLLAIVLAVCLAGCKKKPGAIAELSKADGPVERQAGQGNWLDAPIGTKYVLGDAARTADGGAELKLGGGRAVVKMDPYTVLRFGGGQGGSAQIGVELGAISLTGAGDYGLDVGSVKVGDKGSIRITAKGQGKSSVELLVGTAQIAGLDGQVLELEVGKVLELGIGPIVVSASPDAGVPDAAVAEAPVDAGVPAGDEGSLEVVGKKAEILMPGQTKWTPLPAGMGKLPAGAKIRLGAGTTAKLVAHGVTLSLAGGSRSAISDTLAFSLELGVATTTVPPASEGTVGVPGGGVLVRGTEKGPGKARLDVNAKGEAKVAVLDGSAKLTGAPGTELDMRTGETASIAKAGAIRQTAKIPDYYDLRIAVGETPTFTVHDPRGVTALQFAWSGKCGGSGTIEMDSDSRFRTPRVTGGKDAANILAEAGSWSYRLVCSGGGAVASGRLVVRRDTGTRPLPKEPPVNPIDPDGRTYRISYQSLIPNVKIKAPAGGSRYKLHLATGGVDEQFESTKPSFTIDGKKLKEATYTYWIEKDGVKQDKVSTLIIDFDQTAPQVYIESPSNGRPFEADINVRGAVLPGWSAMVEGVEIPIDKNTRRFAAKVPKPTAAQALAIRLSHPQRGVHFYLRRGSK